VIDFADFADFKLFFEPTD